MVFEHHEFELASFVALHLVLHSNFGVHLAQTGLLVLRQALVVNFDVETAALSRGVERIFVVPEESPRGLCGVQCVLISRVGPADCEVLVGVAQTPLVVLFALLNVFVLILVLIGHAGFVN